MISKIMIAIFWKFWKRQAPKHDEDPFNKFLKSWISATPINQKTGDGILVI